MPVNQTLAQFSDWFYFTAFAFYFLALIVACFFYVRRTVALEQLAEEKNAYAEAKELVSVAAGSGASSSIEGDTTADRTARAAGKSLGDWKMEKAHRLGRFTEMLVFIGIAVHLASVVLRGLSVQRFPWGNLYEYVSVTLLFAMVISAALLFRESTRVFWPWLLTPVIALMFFGGTRLYAESAPVVPALQSYWLPIHVSTVALGASIFLVSGIASLLFIIRSNNPQGKEKGFFGKVARPLPDAKTLDAIAYRTAIWAFPIFGLGIVLGAIWAESAWGRFWGWDPKETFSLVSWVIYSLYLHARATSGWRNSMSAWINILGFATMVFNLFFVNMVISGLHSYAGLN